MKAFAEKLLKILHCKDTVAQRDIIVENSESYDPEAALLFILIDRSIPSDITKDLIEWAEQVVKKG